MKKIPKSSPALLAFYVDWLAWAEAGAPENFPNNPFDFSRGIGLCTNAFYHARISGVEKPYEVEEELKRQFRSPGKYGVRVYYPFGEASYNKNSSNGAMHLCPKRLDWVRNRIKEASE